MKVLRQLLLVRVLESLACQWRRSILTHRETESLAARKIERNREYGQANYRIKDFYKRVCSAAAHRHDMRRVAEYFNARMPFHMGGMHLVEA